MSSPAYQPLPQREVKGDFASPAYSAAHADVEAQRKPSASWKRLLTLTLYAFGLFQLSYLGTRYYLNATHAPAHGGRKLGAPCRGAHRNASHVASLPTHYILPSGDRIPSVALGE